MGRPKIKVNDSLLKGLCARKLKLQDIAVLLECSEDTVERYIKSEYNMRFAEFRDKHLAPTRIKLIDKALEMANGGNTAMMIFCLKNLCDWKDKSEISSEEGKTFKLAYNLNE